MRCKLLGVIVEKTSLNVYVFLDKKKIESREVIQKKSEDLRIGFEKEDFRNSLSCRCVCF